MSSAAWSMLVWTALSLTGTPTPSIDADQDVQRASRGIRDDQPLSRFGRR